MNMRHPRHPGWSDFVDALVLDSAKARTMLQLESSLLEGRGIWGGTPLHFLALEGETDAVSLVLSLGADADPRNDHEETPLLSCVTICTPAQDRVEILKLLLSHGADPYHVAPSQACAWHRARWCEDPRVKAIFGEFPPPGCVHESCQKEGRLRSAMEGPPDSA